MTLPVHAGLLTRVRPPNDGHDYLDFACLLPACLDIASDAMSAEEVTAAGWSVVYPGPGVTCPECKRRVVVRTAYEVLP